MKDCSHCASLCCIAPEIRAPDLWQWRVEGRVIKIINTPCEHLCSEGCSIYESRWDARIACQSYDCKWFWPYLTQYLKDNNLFNSDWSLKPEWLRLFKVMNGMMQLTFYWSQHPDLRDAINYYQSNSVFPDWMISDEYYDYLFKPWVPKVNPRNKRIWNMQIPHKGFLHNFILAFSRFSL